MAKGFEEIEAIAPIDIWRRAEYEVTSAGLSEGPVRASRGTVHVPDALLDEAIGRKFDLIFLPGGRPGADHLAAHKKLGEKLREQAAAGKWIAAICAAPIALKAHGILADKKFICHPSVRDELNPPAIEERIVIDEKAKLATAPGAGAAMELALEVVKILSGEEKVSQIRKAMVF